MAEQIFTKIYTTNSWGSKETVSGPSSTFAKTAVLQSEFPSLIKILKIKSILDCGCGDYHWMSQIPLPNIQYLGVDIVEDLITKNQETYTTDIVHFQKMNILVDPPETADLWLARDFCCLYGYADIKLFFQKFLESNSTYLALTSIQTDTENIDGIVGTWRPWNMSFYPFYLASPVVTLKDDTQWFRKKYLHVYTRDQIKASSLLSSPSTNELVPYETNYDPSYNNTHLKNNIRLRDVKLPQLWQK
jgi:hypothetical protein